MSDLFSVQHNISSMAVRRLATFNNVALTTSLERLSSGYRVNSAADDAAGLVVSEIFRAQVRGLRQAARNAQDAVSLLQTADGAYQEAADILQRMRALAVQAANGSYTNTDRGPLQGEVSQLISELDRMQTSIQFNGMKVLAEFGAAGAYGDSADDSTNTVLSTWSPIVNAVNNLATGVDQSVIITYSFMLPGTNSDDGPAVSFQDQVDGSVTTAEYKQEVIDSFNEWKRLFEDLYSVENGAPANLTVNMVNLGDETGTSVASDFLVTYALPHAETLGDFRVGVTPLAAALAHAFAPVNGLLGTTGDWGGDLHFNNTQDWRQDGEAPSGPEMSVKFVATHEIGHGLGLFHDTDPTSIMDPTAAVADNFGTLFPNGLVGSTPDRNALVKAYGENVFSVSLAKSVHLGANQGGTVALNIDRMSASTLGVNTVDISTQAGAEAAVGTIDDAIESLSRSRTEVGALVNRIEASMETIEIAEHGMTATESRIRDTDMAAEVTQFTQRQILAQSSSSLISQINVSIQGILSLLG